ncbi:SpoIIE family protein phosphatase [Nonomuraea indica]|uniref:SpoIIE family protein phosphatase n=1 Tax=Nonomuraea indica TaxID=1581193 RepID=UPI000C7D2D5F|nr:SpoIIE family protein phosphatase [Nonomuraea indica]
MDPTRVSSRAFDGTPHAPAAARRFVRRVLADWRLGHVADDAVLLTSELVTNAVVHAGTAVELTCRLVPHADPPALEIEVGDRRPALTVAEPGRGLTLAGMLADGWGVTYTGTRKRVWVRLELPGGPDTRHAEPEPAAPLETLHVGVVVTGADGRVLSWNPGARALLGWPPEQVAGRPLGGLLARDRTGLLSPGPPSPPAGAFAGGLSSLDPSRLGRWRGEAWMRHADGRPVQVYVSHVRAREGCSVWMVVPLEHRYVLATPAAPLRRETAGRIKDVLGHDRPLAELLDTVAQIVHAAGGGDASYVLLRDDDNRLPATGAPPRTDGRGAGGTPPRPPDGRPADARVTGQRGSRAGHAGRGFGVAAGAGATAGLVGVLSTGVFGTDHRSPVVVGDVLTVDVELAQRLRARSLACAPLVVADEVIGHLVVTAAEPFRFDDELAEVLGHIAGQVAATVHRERAAERERARHGRLSFLAEAGELLAGARDEELIAALTAQLVVPKIASWAAVYLTDLAGMTRLAHAWHSDERLNSDLRHSLPAIPAVPVPPGASAPAPDQDREAMTPSERGAQAASLARADDGPPPARPLAGPDAPVETLPGRREEGAWPIGEETVLSFPLLTQGRSYGALVIGRVEPTLPLELAGLLTDLCRLVALNLHTAMLYARQATTSRALQRGLLPGDVASMPGVESAVVYQPAEEGADVGGDFYDLFVVGDHWCFALGDVCGSGPEAAAATGLARHAVRLLAKERYTVADILHRLNRTLLEDVEEGRFLSLLCGELAPLPGGGALCTVACAGHPPPLLLRADGTVRAVATPQLLLGIEHDVRFFAETFELAPGEVLLCVTDGVTERRSGGRLLDDDDGLARLLAGCAGLSAHAVAERVRQAVEEFAAEPSNDDVALLVLKATAPAGTRARAVPADSPPGLAAPPAAP